LHRLSQSVWTKEEECLDQEYRYPEVKNVEQNMANLLVAQ
jgi:hypothetical protein